MPRFAHIINPFKARATHELSRVQPITFETLQRARQQASPGIEVNLLTAQFPEAHDIIPEGFQKTPDLERSVLDIRAFPHARKLPLVRDILDRLYQNSEAEYLIFTNADIAVMPYFYEAIAQLLAQGHDALIINRRRIPGQYFATAQLPLIYAEIGRSHPGFDCFVFHRKLYPQFVLGNICVGVPSIGVTLAHNIFALAENFHLIDDKHLTLHIGMGVMPPRDKPYYRHNRNEFNRLLPELKPRLRADRLPYAALPWYRKVVKWALNPSTFIGLNLHLEAKNRSQRLKAWLDEIRFKLLEIW